MPNKTAVMDTARGMIELELFADEVPDTVALTVRDWLGRHFAPAAG